LIQTYLNSLYCLGPNLVDKIHLQIHPFFSNLYSLFENEHFPLDLQRGRVSN
jgi:hypothetical protein